MDVSRESHFHLITPSSADPSGAGGKGENLWQLGKIATVAVPAWVAVGSDVFRAQPDEQQLSALVARACAALGEVAVAVRSSASVEDGATTSYAGQFDTVLGVTGTSEVLAALRQCWDSATTARVSSYQRALGDTRTIDVAVVIQRLVNADVSGVIFTANPVSGADDEYLVNAVYGLGESLVSGEVDADTVILDAHTGAVRSQQVGAKQHRRIGSQIEEVPDELRTQLALSQLQLAELYRTASEIAAHFKCPQDIEWAYEDGQLYVLQTRPITTAVGTRALWDNSNLVESFHGVTSALTFTVAREIYYRAYRGYAKSLAVPTSQLAQIDLWMPDILGRFHGNIYYQLLHRYRMARLAPGYRLTRRVLEVALGVSEPLPDDTLDALHPFTFAHSWSRYRYLIHSRVRFIRRYLGNDREVADFLSEFYAHYDRYDALDFESMTSAEIFTCFRDMERDLVDRWGPTMIGDDNILLTVGVVHLLARRWLPEAPGWLTFASVAPGQDVESAQPARAITELAELVKADAELGRALESGESLDDFPDFQRKYDDYIREYGYRSPDELMLETADLREDPRLLVPMILAALDMPTDVATIATDAEPYLNAHLHGWRRWSYDKVRGRGAKLMANRERLRFCRSRAFGLAKRMCRAIGRDLASNGILQQWDDVFHLELDELRAYFDGTIDAEQLPVLVAARRAQAEYDAGFIAPARFETVGAADDQALRRAGWRHCDDPVSGPALDSFQGVASAPGIVEDEVIVARDPADFTGGILLAYRTDPGWVGALASARALLVERGSPLTHVAVVARELGIPTVVQLPGITESVRSGDRLYVDGSTGEVRVLQRAAVESSL